MALIEWSSDLSVGIVSIDQQHQKLIGMINDLDNAMRQGKGNTIIGSIISKLIAYTREHFANEERYFEHYSYPGMAEHMDEHQKFIQEVAGFKTRFDEKQLGLSISLINFLSDWLRKHIMGTDKAYAPFFKEHGVV